MQQIHDDGIVAGRVHDDFTLERDGIDMDDIVPRHFGRGIVDDHTFQDTVSSEDQVDYSREIHDPGSIPIGRCHERAGRMGWVDDIHAVAVFDLLAGDADLFEDLVRRGADGGLVHQIAAVPESTAQGETLFYDHGAEAHVGQIVCADQTGWSGADNDDIAFDQLVEFLVVFARDLSGDISFTKGRWFGLRHIDSIQLSAVSDQPSALTSELTADS